VERDPQFAWAIAELGREHLNLFWYLTRRDADRDRARALLDRATAIAPDDPHIQLAMAEYHYRAHLDYDAALAALARVETHLPGSSELMSLRAYVLRRKGDVAGTLAALQAAARLDPRSLDVIRTLVETYWLIGELDQVDRWQEHLVVLPDADHWERSIPRYAHFQRQGTPQRYLDGRLDLDELNSGDVLDIRNEVFWYSYLLRDFERAEAELEAVDLPVFADQFNVVPRPLMHAYLARALGQASAVHEHAGAARAILEEMLEEHPDDYRAWAALGAVRALLGDARGAVDAVARAQANPLVQRDVLLQAEVHRIQVLTLALTAESPVVAEEVERFLQREMNYWGYGGLMLDPVFDAHREHPAFQALAARYSRR
jgi:Tfp pilus assembly protein PilF